MLLLNQVYLPLDTDMDDLRTPAAKTLRCDTRLLKSVRLYRRSVDARHKNDVRFCCSLMIESEQEDRLCRKNKNAVPFSVEKYVWKKAEQPPRQRPVVVGFGPAGMFAALALAEAGLCPIVLERGQDADTRTADVRNFFAGGKLNTESNVQFGEGGAGTFSDGKLNSGIKDPRCRAVLECFVQFGAPEKILTDAKPHIGTDILVAVVKNLRKRIVESGGEVRFGTKLDGLCFADGQLESITANGQKIPCDRLILACGHSARDTFSMLRDSGIKMIRKPFSMGVRIEHLQKDINRALYGDFADHPALGAADYKLSAHLENGRGVYTFCMCPGGRVINASSETGGIAVNGMSYSQRDGENANSALLVDVRPDDLPGADVLAGCALQRRVETAAYKIANGSVPVMTVGAFLRGKANVPGRVRPTVLPQTVFTDLSGIFPDFVVDSLRQALPVFDRKIRGFSDDDALLSAPETRSSSPVRIVRNEDGQSVSCRGLYPCGEGAGYAGGILSAAVDGIKTAEKLLDSLKE